MTSAMSRCTRERVHKQDAVSVLPSDGRRAIEIEILASVDKDKSKRYKIRNHG